MSNIGNPVAITLRTILTGLIVELQFTAQAADLFTDIPEEGIAVGNRNNFV